MKRYGNLTEYWCNYDTLLRAVDEVKIGKTFHHGFLRYEMNLADNLENLLQRLQDGSYMPQEPREFKVYEPKERLIHAPALEDRIVQHAVLIVVRDMIERRFIHHSYACRKDRGTHRASAQLKRWLIQYSNTGYYLKVDISKFFYSIDHAVLTNQLRRIIKCEDTIMMIQKFYGNDGVCGLPLGNVTSQVLANLALNDLDHFVKRELKIEHYIRYMDDMVLLHKDKDVLKQALTRIVEFVYKLNLKVNSKTHIGGIGEGIDFVGYRTWYNRRVIRKRTLHGVKRKAKKGSVQTISSLLSHSKNTNSISYVVKTLMRVRPDFTEFIKNWIVKNQNEVHNEIFQS